ncbi:MAG: GAF domain-containing protein [Anaerolineae bacterium]|nr:GAF domain-containing protein [Anaerolineae bacterium]MDQ7033829.1 GAF domain-containing protein [Anaerolineae bacterium]
MSINHAIDSYWNRLSLLSSRGNLSPHDRLNMMLNIGLDALGMDMGIVSRVVGQEYSIEFCSNRRYEGTQFALNQTYCDLTLHHNDVVDITHISQSPKQHSVYNALQIESYIGLPLELHGQTYGTLCFVRAEPRSHTFSQDDINFMCMLAQAVRNTLEEMLVCATY